MIFTEKSKLVWGTEPKNWTGAASTGKTVALKRYNRVRFIIQTGAWAAGTVAITLSQGQDIAGTGAKALAFDTMWTNKAAPTTDTLVKTTVASNTFNLDTANSLWVIEVKAEDLDVTNGFCTLHCDGASPGANADFYAVVAEVLEPTFHQATPPTAMLD